MALLFFYFLFVFVERVRSDLQRGFYIADGVQEWTEDGALRHVAAFYKGDASDTVEFFDAYWQQTKPPGVAEAGNKVVEETNLFTIGDPLRCIHKKVKSETTGEVNGDTFIGICMDLTFKDDTHVNAMNSQAFLERYLDSDVLEEYVIEKFPVERGYRMDGGMLDTRGPPGSGPSSRRTTPTGPQLAGGIFPTSTVRVSSGSGLPSTTAASSSSSASATPESLFRRNGSSTPTGGSRSTGGPHFGTGSQMKKANFSGMPLAGSRSSSDLATRSASGGGLTASVSTGGAAASSSTPASSSAGLMSSGRQLLDQGKSAIATAAGAAAERGREMVKQGAVKRTRSATAEAPNLLFLVFHRIGSVYQKVNVKPSGVTPVYRYFIYDVIEDAFTNIRTNVGAQIKLKLTKRHDKKKAQKYSVIELGDSGRVSEKESNREPPENSMGAAVQVGEVSNSKKPSLPFACGRSKNKNLGPPVERVLRVGKAIGHVQSRDSKQASLEQNLELQTANTYIRYVDSCQKPGGIQHSKELYSKAFVNVVEPTGKQKFYTVSHSRMQSHMVIKVEGNGEDPVHGLTYTSTIFQGGDKKLSSLLESAKLSFAGKRYIHNQITFTGSVDLMPTFLVLNLEEMPVDSWYPVPEELTEALAKAEQRMEQAGKVIANTAAAVLEQASRQNTPRNTSTSAERPHSNTAATPRTSPKASPRRGRSSSAEGRTPPKNEDIIKKDEKEDEITPATRGRSSSLNSIGGRSSQEDASSDEETEESSEDEVDNLQTFAGPMRTILKAWREVLPKPQVPETKNAPGVNEDAAGNKNNGQEVSAPKNDDEVQLAPPLVVEQPDYGGNNNQRQSNAGTQQFAISTPPVLTPRLPGMVEDEQDEQQVIQQRDLDPLQQIQQGNDQQQDLLDQEQYYAENTSFGEGSFQGDYPGAIFDRHADVVFQPQQNVYAPQQNFGYHEDEIEKQRQLQRIRDMQPDSSPSGSADEFGRRQFGREPSGSSSRSPRVAEHMLQSSRERKSNLDTLAMVFAGAVVVLIIVSIVVFTLCRNEDPGEDDENDSDLEPGDEDGTRSRKSSKLRKSNKSQKRKTAQYNQQKTSGVYGSALDSVEWITASRVYSNEDNLLGGRKTGETAGRQTTNQDFNSNQQGRQTEQIVQAKRSVLPMDDSVGTQNSAFVYEVVSGDMQVGEILVDADGKEYIVEEEIF